MRFFFIYAVISFFAVTNAFAVPLENLVSSSQAQQLRAGGELIMETQLRNPVPKLMPNNSELRQFIAGISNSLNPNMMVEALYLFRKPNQFHTSASSWDSGQKLQIFNQLLAISTLTGIQYFSASRNAMRTFYEFSGVIDGPQSRNPASDPVFFQIPDTFNLYARQRDLTFGDNIYLYNFFNTADAVFFVQENITSLTYGIIPAIGRNNLQSVIAIIDSGDSILIYAASMAKAVSLPGMGDRISNSFKNRAEAVLKWLSGRLITEVFQ